MQLYKIILYSFISLQLLVSSVFGQTDLKVANEEHTFLLSLLNEGHTNSNLYLKLSKTAENQANALCYARLGLALSPDNSQLKQQVEEIRGLSKAKEISAVGEKTSNSTPSLLILLNTFPRHQLLNVLSIITTCSLLLILFRLAFRKGKRFRFAQNTLHTISILLFFQIFLITQTKDGRYRLATSLEDINKIEGVVLSEIIVFSGPSKDSQQVNILKPTWEINLYPNKQTAPWILIETSDKRRGWISELPHVCTLNH